MEECFYSRVVFAPHLVEQLLRVIRVRVLETAEIRRGIERRTWLLLCNTEPCEFPLLRPGHLGRQLIHASASGVADFQPLKHLCAYLVQNPGQLFRDRLV